MSELKYIKVDLVEQGHRCPWILKSGKNKGLVCGRLCKTEFCVSHTKKSKSSNSVADCLFGLMFAFSGMR